MDYPAARTAWRGWLFRWHVDDEGLDLFPPPCDCLQNCTPLSANG
jgi:hypothetical protein